MLPLSRFGHHSEPPASPTQHISTATAPIAAPSAHDASPSNTRFAVEDVRDNARRNLGFGNNSSSAQLAATAMQGSEVLPDIPVSELSFVSSIHSSNQDTPRDVFSASGTSVTSSRSIWTAPADLAAGQAAGQTSPHSKHGSSRSGTPPAAAEASWSMSFWRKGTHEEQVEQHVPSQHRPLSALVVLLITSACSTLLHYLLCLVQGLCLKVTYKGLSL